MQKRAARCQSRLTLTVVFIQKMRNKNSIFKKLKKELCWKLNSAHFHAKFIEKYWIIDRFLLNNLLNRWRPSLWWQTNRSFIRKIRNKNSILKKLKKELCWKLNSAHFDAKFIEKYWIIDRFWLNNCVNRCAPIVTFAKVLITSGARVCVTH